MVKARATSYKSIYMVTGTSTPFDDETDGLTPIPSPVSDGKIYDLSGRRVTSPRKGIYIMDGKKIAM